MNIVKENIGNLNEHVTVELAPADYQEAVGKNLRDLRRRANVPGFRVGHVPMGMIERQYKKSVMLDVISQRVNEELDKYLKENNIRILFEPLAVPEKTKADFDHDGEFSFTFEIGVRPEVKIDYSKAAGVPYLKVQASEQQIDEEAQKLRRRLGRFSSTEEVVDGDMAVVHVDAGDGSEPISTSLPTTYFKEEHRNVFVGKKLHETFELDTKEMLVSDYERATLLNRKPADLDGAPVKVTVSIDAIHHVELADLDEEFFSRAFPDEEVKDEAAMRSRLKEQIERNFETQERMQYRGAAMEALMSGLDITLPDAFVKRYLIDKHSDTYTAENIEERYPDLQKSLCFQLVESAIAEEGKVEINREDIVGYLQRYMASNYFGTDYARLTDDQKRSIDSLAENMMKEEKTVNNAYDNLYFERITDVILEKAGSACKNVTWDEFLSGSSVKSAEPKAKKVKSRKAADKDEAPVADAAAGNDADTTEEAKPKRKAAAKKPAAKK